MNEGRRKPHKSEIFVKSDQFPIFFDFRLDIFS